MLSSKAHLALIGMRDNILAAQNFTKDISFDEFSHSLIHFYAVTRALEIISEAARRLPEPFYDKHASLPWKQIIAAGNIYRHEYGKVQARFVWDTVENYLPPMLLIVVAEIEEHEGDT